MNSNSNVLVEFTGEDGTRFSIRKDLIVAIKENPDGSTTLGVAWPAYIEWREKKELRYGDVIDKLCKTKEEK